MPKYKKVNITIVIETWYVTTKVILNWNPNPITKKRIKKTTCAISAYHHFMNYEFESHSCWGVLDKTLCDEVYQRLAAGICAFLHH